jgi:hypothetical protein
MTKLKVLRRGMSGVDVGMAQQLLVECGYSLPHTELVGFIFGDGTFNAVRNFQASHVGPTGKALEEDGVIGAQTWYALQHPGHDNRFIVSGWRCEPSKARQELQLVLTSAVGEIGAYEEPDGSNDGPKIRKFTSPNFIGSPWCALFVSWCYSKVFTGSPFGRIASTWGLYEWARFHRRLVAENAPPEPGDVFVILRGSEHDSNRRGHTGLIVSVLDDGMLCTVAGNESNAIRGNIRSRGAFSAILRPLL